MRDEIKTVEDYVRTTNQLQEQIRDLENEKSRVWEIAREFSVPVHLRPAIETDIVDDAVLWYPHFSGRKWLIVRGGNPNDYLGLGAFVEEALPSAGVPA